MPEKICKTTCQQARDNFRHGLAGPSPVMDFTHFPKRTLRDYLMTVIIKDLRTALHEVALMCDAVRPMKERKKAVNIMLNTRDIIFSHLNNIRGCVKAARSNSKHADEAIKQDAQDALRVHANSDVVDVIDKLKSLASNIESLATATNSKRIDARQLRSSLAEIKAEATGTVSSLTSTEQYILKSQTFDSGSGQMEAMDASVRTSNLIEKYAAEFKSKLPMDVKVIGSAKLPILAKFGSLRVTKDRLTSMGLSVQPLSLNKVGQAELGLVLENQTIIAFKVENAENFNKGIRKGSLKQATARKQVSKLSKQKVALEESLEEAKADLVIITKKDIAARRLALTRKKEISAELDKVKLMLKSFQDKADAENALLNQQKRDFSRDSDSKTLRYAESLLDDINQSLDYGMVTSSFLHKQGKKQDLVYMWVMERPLLRRLLDIDDLKLQQWGFPWGR